MLEITEANFQTEVANAPGSVLLDFWAPWCGPCRALAPQFEKWSKDHAARAKFAKVNVDEAQGLAVSFRVSSIPTVILLREGKEVRRWVGVPREDEIKAALN
jgi:thioredoxin 1